MNKPQGGADANESDMEEIDGSEPTPGASVTPLDAVRSQLVRCRDAVARRDRRIKKLLETVKQYQTKPPAPEPPQTQPEEPDQKPDPKPTVPEPQPYNPVQLPSLPVDYAKIWADHWERDGGSVRDESLRRAVYLEAMDRLRAGEFTDKKANGIDVAETIDSWVASQFYSHSIRTPALDDNIYHQAYQAFCYQNALEELRTGRILVPDHEKIAAKVDKWVRLEYMRRLTN